jgi:guanylate kinase
MMQTAGPGITRRGIMFVIASPSGAGKSTLSRLLLQNDANLQLSVSVTTRARRPSEVEGVHYHFVDAKRYRGMIAAGELLEHAEVHGNGYGSPRAPVESALDAGRDMLFDVDWQGTAQLYEQMPADIVSVFILPPSIPELAARLERRAEDPPDVIARRLDNAAREMVEWGRFDYVLVNGDLDATFAALRSILEAERLRRVRQNSLAGFVERLVGQIEQRSLTPAATPRGA